MPARFPILLFAPNASTSFGGEAARPLRYFLELHRRGIAAHLLVHGRNQRWLEAGYPSLSCYIHYVPEAPVERWLAKLGDRLPERIHTITTGMLLWMATQWRARPLIRDLVRRKGLQLIHQPIPISPRAPSLVYGFGIPVIVGPLNGAIDYPPAFRHREALLSRLLVSGARMLARPLGALCRGLPEARVVLVCNGRTRAALPPRLRGRVVELVANGVDTQDYAPRAPGQRAGPVRLLFCGRLVKFKGIDLLLLALARLPTAVPVALEIVGDGAERRALEAQARSLGLQARVSFSGWVDASRLADCYRRADVFVLPSLREAGGAVVMEAMAVGLPVVAAAWGGPADYLPAAAGIRVPVGSESGFVEGLAAAISRLVTDDRLRERMGAAGRRAAVTGMDWRARGDALEGIYRGVVAGNRRASVPARRCTGSQMG
ncbi:glycosyltransferase family 4 protein [Microbulbifer sp. YPW16]|uniref:glycosyltransferase family 4 protein n=1 Tax=Microbulbifer sp. YPW16 TaxID=2904242 RepID=UPI001E542F86|nr:glycosyltransferase family 4 protein [Microbulbifer sp. YPW16]UHQ54916.1 glycosyltransferase family 4 protein [Microbulbifer sp. YPW16]